MNELIRYLRGYVKIKVSGEFTENFINLCAKNGISIWGIEKLDDDIYLNLYAEKFILLFGLRHQMKEKTSIKLLEKHGLMIFFKKYNKRKGLILGFALFLLINTILSQFVWDITVIGNQTISENDIIKTCNEMGINIGDYRKSVDTYNAKQLLAMRYDNIAWVSLNVEGSRVIVNISEAQISQHNDNYTPRNIIALEDGVVKKIKVTKGEKKITKGQAVKKGDILVSGVVDNVVASHIVEAEGEIIAETTRNYFFEIKKNYSIENLDTNAEYRDVFEFFWLKVPLYLNGINFENKSEFSNNNFKLFGKELPIGIARRTYYPLTKETIILCEEDAKSVAMERIVDNLKKLELEKVVNNTISVAEEEGIYKISASVLCLENIAKYVPINTDGY